MNKKAAKRKWSIADVNIMEESSSRRSFSSLFAIKSGRNLIKDIINAKEKKLTISKRLKIYAFIPNISLPK
jgi:hypothetical protein